ncbi:MAG: nuclear transport factor 2 family protein [Gammaproteobacteria bacterium]|jgi:hypothetical protein
MRKSNFLVGASLAASTFLLGVVWAQRSGAPELTAQDYYEIEQLMYRYAHAIDTCSNNGYDYADLYTDDGIFVDNFTDEGFGQDGLVRAVGREALARAAGGGDRGCRNVGWNGWSHLIVNPVITATEEGARGRAYLVVIGERGPDHFQRFGGYEDTYVRTSDGWRIKQRAHVRNKAWSNPLLQSPDLH